MSVGSSQLASYTYSEDGDHLLTSLRYQNGDRIEYSYDDQGRVTQKRYFLKGGGVPSRVMDFSYTSDDSVASVYEYFTGITTRYYYDEAGRVTLRAQTGGESSNSISYTYNAVGQLSQKRRKVDGQTNTTTYTYDDQGRVSQTVSGLVITSYSYDDLDRMVSKTVKHGNIEIIKETYTYRAGSDRVAQVSKSRYDQASSSTVALDTSVSYTYDGDGNIISVTQGSVGTTKYTYDGAGQLIREDNGGTGKSWTWTYDNAGNILSHGEYAYTTGELGTAVDTVEYGYTAAVWGYLLCTYDGVGLGCDDLGNLTHIGNRRYVWKHGRELSQVIESGTTWTYTYNADGLRTGRTDGTTSYQYIYADGQLVKQRIGTSTMSFAYDAAGTPMSVQYGGANYYYVTNLQGDVIAITNDAGAAVVSYTYDAWGQILSITGSMANTLGKYNPLRYRGYVYDRETELYYLQSRYYDPEIGRFISPDGYTSTGQGFVGANMFAYCGNCPVTNRDSCGTMFDRTAGGFGCGGGLAWSGPGGASATAAIVIPLIVYPELVELGADALRELMTSGFRNEIFQSKPTPNSDDSEDSVPGELGKIASSVGLFGCKEAADDMADYLKENDLDAAVITISFRGGRGFVWSDIQSCVISENGIHVGVEYKGIVYCNVHPFGLPEMVWINDFCGTGEKTVSKYPI